MNNNMSPAISWGFKPESPNDVWETPKLNLQRKCVGFSDTDNWHTSVLPPPSLSMNLFTAAP